MGLLERSPQALPCLLIDAATSQKHSVNRLCVRDVLKGVGTEDHQISTATLSDHADIFLDLKEPSSVSSGDTDHVQSQVRRRQESVILRYKLPDSLNRNSYHQVARCELNRLIKSWRREPLQQLEPCGEIRGHA